MAIKYAIGADIGTTSAKAVVFDMDGHATGEHAVEYPLHSPEPGAAEQDPDQIVHAVVEAIAGSVRKSGARPEQIVCVGFSSAMHSVIAMDGDGRALTACLTWADNRSADWTDKLRSEWGGLDIYKRTGTPIHPMSPLSKLIWLRHDRRELFEHAHKFISIKEYVLYRLFGQYAVDLSIASATGMLGMETLDWDEEALSIAGIGPDKLSELVPATHQLKGLDFAMADRMGLQSDTPFVVGSSDGVLSNIGLDAWEPGIAAVTIGTSGAIRVATDKPVADPLGRTFCYALNEKQWVAGGPVNNGAILLRWVRDEFGQPEKEAAAQLGRDAYDLLMELADQAPPGSEGLIFHPYLAGERAPLWDSDARGSYYGLSLRHKRTHMVRAVLEGVMYNLRVVLGLVEELAGKSERIHASGGFARSPLWRQMMADVFNRDVHLPAIIESSCLGAARVALHSIGELPAAGASADAPHRIGQAQPMTHIHRPNPEHAAVYAELMNIYDRLQPALSAEYGAIAQFQRKHSQ